MYMSQINIYPSILALIDHPETWIERVKALPVPLAGIQYDVGDGDFVPSKMLPIENLSYLEGVDLPVDVHLMVRWPSEYFEQIFKFSCVTAVGFHVECDEDIHENIQTLRNAGKKVGLAIMHDTPADHLDQYLLEIDYVIAMTVRWGYSGDPFIPEVMQKITEIHHKNPELPIVVDGGVGEKTLSLCVEAGANRAVMSGALFGGKDLTWLKEYDMEK